MLDVKQQNYINKRGWTIDTIDTAIKGGIKGTSTNLATGNLARVYTTSKGYVVVNPNTGVLITIYSSSWFDSNMLKIVAMLFWQIGG